jgi:FKBP-type peptidyl-prolyl cis-trans isomerase 2
MAEAKQGDSVKVHYTGRLADGTEFDSSHDQAPLEFTVGAGEVIPGFDQAVVGMQPGESKTTTIPAGEAYGDYDDELVMEVDRDQFPPNIQPEVGQRLQLRQVEGDDFSVVVTEINDDTVTLDGNHPLAGHDLTFDIELVAIGEASSEKS